MITLVSSLIGAVEAGLKLWGTKEGRKYLDEILELKQDWVNEYNKETHERSDAKLDLIEQRIMLISELFSSKIGNEDSKNL
jgi:hypothetical protein